MKSKPMEFKEWLLKRHLGRDTRIGDLARDVRDDHHFPDTDDVFEMYDYIHNLSGSCRGALIALLEAYVKWSDYYDDFWGKN